MNAKLKALLWEECRTGGVIAGWIVVVCFAVFYLFRGILNPDWLMRETYQESALFVIYMAGFGVSLLQILSIDYSGRLASGFSRRVLNLPVETRTAVFAALAPRTLFVAAAMSVLWAVHHLAFPGGVSVALVFFFVLLYLAAQLFDWLRHVVSGLTSLAGLFGLLLMAALFFDEEHALAAIFGALSQSRAGVWLPSLGLGLLAAAFAGTYVCGLAAVRACRKGHIVGIPEIWEWPQHLAIGQGRTRPFGSAIAAQTWHDFRRFGWVMPLTALVLLTVLVVLRFATAIGMTNSREDLSRAVLYAFGLGGAVIASAALQSLAAGLVQRRKDEAKTTYVHRCPLSTADLALARILTNAWSLGLTLALAWLVHIFVLERGFYFNPLPDAWALGLVNAQEMVWILFSRLFLMGLLAWFLLQGRFAAYTLGLIFAMPLAIAILVGIGLLDGDLIAPLMTIGLSLWLIGSLLVGYGYAWAKGLLTLRAVIAWIAAWLALAVLFFSTGAAQMSKVEVPAPWMFLLLGSLAFAAVLPLPYVRTAIDLHRLRHGARPTQDPRQHDGRPFSAKAWAPLTILVLTAAFLAWPTQPGFVSVWKQQGWPATYEELDAWYPAVPAEENVALRYEELGREREALEDDFWRQLNAAPIAPGEEDPLEQAQDNLPVVGDYTLTPGTPLPPDVWETTQAYRRAVTTKIVPELEELAALDNLRSRYPADLTEGFAVLLPYLSEVRSLARECRMAALAAAVEDRNSDAVDAALAIPPIADSLAKEPLLISQLVRIATLEIGCSAVETILNLTVLDEADLARLQDAYANALPPYEEERILKRALTGESLLALRGVEDSIGGPLSGATGELALEKVYGGAYLPALLMAWQLPAERAAAAEVFYNASTQTPKQLPQSLEAEERLTEDFYRNAGSMAMMSAILAPSTARVSEAEIRARTRLAMTTTALAVERCRLAHGELPESLDDLVPDYLDAVPIDLYRREPAPLGYRILPGDGWEISCHGWWESGSVRNRDGKRGLGYQIGGLTFTVAPLSVRTGPQIAEEGSEPSSDSEDPAAARLDPFRSRRLGGPGVGLDAVEPGAVEPEVAR